MSSLPQHDAPHGMEEYDLTRYGYLGALSEEQQDRLNAYKVSRTNSDIVRAVCRNNHRVHAAGLALALPLALALALPLPWPCLGLALALALALAASSRSRRAG